MKQRATKLRVASAAIEIGDYFVNPMRGMFLVGFSMI